MNVVSIDFDIIMEPDINFYNNWVADNTGINDYIKEYKILENLKANLYIYEYLTRFLIQTIKTIESNKIFFIESHETITKLIDESSFNLYNIDHHHDIYYDDKNITLPLLDCTCGNWIKFLMDAKKIKKYTWIKNSNSDEPDGDVAKYYKHEQKILQETNLTKIAEDIDILIICRSPEWVPEYYFPLFDAWIAICEEYYGEPFKII